MINIQFEGQQPSEVDQFVASTQKKTPYKTHLGLQLVVHVKLEVPFLTIFAHRKPRLVYRILL
jgi:hypothetical protein